MKHFLCLEIMGAQMYATVMELVERNKSIKITKAELVIESGSPKKVTTRHRSEGRFEDIYYDTLIAGELITTSIVADWCKQNGYAESSATSICSLLVKKGKLQKGNKRGEFKVLL